MKLCYLAGAIMHFKKFNKFIYFEFLPMKKGSHKCWKIHVFKLKSCRLVSRKLQKTRTSVMISSRMFGIFVINEAIENTCNLLKNDVFNQWSWALLKWRLQTMMMTFMEWWPRMSHEWWVQECVGWVEDEIWWRQVVVLPPQAAASYAEDPEGALSWPLWTAACCALHNWWGQPSLRHTGLTPMSLHRPILTWHRLDPYIAILGSSSESTLAQHT